MVRTTGAAGRGVADSVSDGHEGGKLGDEVRVGERDEVLGVSGGVGEEEDELEEARREADP